ncbi:hypothetical protein C0995_003989 [Termitomyces sp. Mi166|nr:hypothetical protein C0995_003989 [Termitomyces sp. Mi166\
MVKRPKSPDTAEDEKYFTVYQPYPLNVNWELSSDYIAFSRWIAACIGTDPLHALHYKPSARGMVLIEVDKKYPYNERLLGEHRWKEFLRNPTDEEQDRVTQIFHSLYTTGREAQKDGTFPSGHFEIAVLIFPAGWKRIHVESKWFKDWSPRTEPLPVKVKPPPPKPVPPIPGSVGWVSSKAAPSQNTPQAQKIAWEGKKLSAPSATPSAWDKPIVPTASTAPSQARPTPVPSASGTSPQPQGAWGKPPPTTVTSPTSPTSPRAGLNVRPEPGRSLPAPPGLTKPRWSDQVENVASGSGSDSRSSDGTDKVLSGAFEEKVTITLSPSQNRQLYGLDVNGDATPELESQVIHPWEANIPTLDSTKWSTVDATPSVNLWGEDTGPKGEAVAECPYHKNLCKKGLCEWRARKVKEEQRIKALGAKIDEGSKGGSKGKGRGGKTGGWRKNPSSPSTVNGDDDDDGFSYIGGRRRLFYITTYDESCIPADHIAMYYFCKQRNLDFLVNRKTETQLALLTHPPLFNPSESLEQFRRITQESWSPGVEFDNGPEQELTA